MSARRGMFAAALFGASALAVVPVARAQTPPPEDFDPGRELRRIAKMKQDERLLASFAEARGRAESNLSETALMAIVDTVEKTGYPNRATKMLEERVRRHPTEVDARVTLAKVLTRAGQTKTAIPVWKETAAKFGLRIPDALAYAQALTVAGDSGRALAVLSSVKERAPDDAIEYWKSLAHVAWSEDDAPTALIAYRKLFNADPPVPQASSRLMQLLSDAGDIDGAIAVAKQALVREKNPGHLLFVARLQIKQGNFAGAKATLDLADDRRALVASTLEYWMLRAEVLTQTGDHDGARLAYRTALALDPGAPGVRAALLWDAIERADFRTLASSLKEWAPDAERDKEMWAPTAIGLDRIGRTRDALRFFALQLKETPSDHLWSLEVADALSRVGQDGMAARLRRHAFVEIRALARASLSARDDPAGPKLLAANVLLTQLLHGDAEANRWLDWILANGKPSLELEELAIAFYLAEPNVDRARRHLAKARALRLGSAADRRYRLLVAMAEDDRTEIATLLDQPSGLTDAEKAAAYLSIERDAAAVAPLVAVLDRADVTAETRGGTVALPIETDAPTLRRELRAIDERTSPTLRGGGSFAYFNDLVTVGPSAAASHLLQTNRLSYAAGARTFEDLGAASVAVSGTKEADAHFALRSVAARRTTELGLGVEYQTGSPLKVPAPRAWFGQRLQLTRKVAVGYDIAFQKRMEDTSFLRVAGLRDVATGDVYFEPVWRLYLLGAVLLQEDHTRTFDYLGFEAGGTVEGGLRILEKIPEWTAGLRVGAYGRDNRRDIPDDYRAIVKPGESRSALYPPSFQEVLFTTRISRGDFFERSRQELVGFPRYDCEIDGGLLLGVGIQRVSPAPVVAVRCAASFRLPTSGYFSAAGDYIKGVSGIAQADNASVSLTYTQFLR